MTAVSQAVIRASQMLPVFGAPDYAFEPLDLEIHSGTLTCVVGPDRSGKTRYMRTLAGLDVPASGAVELLTQDVSHLSSRDWLRLRPAIGFIGPETVLTSHLDGLENVIFPALYHGYGLRAAVESRARALLASVGARDYEGVFPSSMREIHRRELIVARALLLDPVALLLDNPFGMLDVLVAAELNLFLLNEMNERKMALVMATEDLAFAEQHSSQILFIARGCIRRFDGVEAFREADAAEVQRFLEMSARK